ncbi:unnamed protein product [Protopolystoma xenopodis]|uniref:Glycoside hydrolase family 38 central domain-containing protein n=1 Tax=Protopolystoma xenopodis TaxID=117903 RepID=A0A3S5BEZ7_9PLAT|nr:unnamed protein product [Protopolystoma xenopodis]
MYRFCVRSCPHGTVLIASHGRVHRPEGVPNGQSDVFFCFSSRRPKQLHVFTGFADLRLPHRSPRNRSAPHPYFVLSDSANTMPTANFNTNSSPTSLATSTSIALQSTPVLLPPGDSPFTPPTYPDANVDNNVNAKVEVGKRDMSMAEEETVARFRQVLGVMQHHDAVTGTEKQHVARDYSRQIAAASTDAEGMAGRAVLRLTPDLAGLMQDGPGFCDLVNISICRFTSGSLPYVTSAGHDGLFIIVYNPLSWALTSAWLRLPVSVAAMDPSRVVIRLRDMRIANSRDPSQTNDLLPWQLAPISAVTSGIPERRTAEQQTNMELTFNAATVKLPIPAFGYTTLHLSIQAREERERLREATDWERRSVGRGWLKRGHRDYGQSKRESTSRSSASSTRFQQTRPEGRGKRSSFPAPQ